ASTDDFGVTHYEVFRDGISLGTTPSLSMQVTPVACNTTFSMTVKAFDGGGNSSNESAPLEVATLECTEVNQWSDNFNGSIPGAGWFGNGQYSLTQSNGILTVNVSKTEAWKSFGVNIPET